MQLEAAETAGAALQAQLDEARSAAARRAHELAQATDKLAAEHARWDALAAQQQGVLEAAKAERDAAVDASRRQAAQVSAFGAAQHAGVKLAPS